MGKIMENLTSLDDAITIFEVIKHPEQYEKKLDQFKAILKKNEFTLKTIGNAKEINALHETAKVQRAEAIETVNEAKQTASSLIETAKSESSQLLSNAKRDSDRLTLNAENVNRLSIEREKTSKTKQNSLLLN